MKYRKPMKKKASKKLFSKTAVSTKKINLRSPTPLRGGTRL